MPRLECYDVMLRLVLCLLTSLNPFLLNEILLNLHAKSRWILPDGYKPFIRDNDKNANFLQKDYKDKDSDENNSGKYLRW